MTNEVFLRGNQQVPIEGHRLCRLGLYLEQKIRKPWLGS